MNNNIDFIIYYIGITEYYKINDNNNIINIVMVIIITIRQLCNLGAKIIKTISRIHGSTLTGAAKPMQIMQTRRYTVSGI
jgi:hypothetical protein